MTALLALLIFFAPAAWPQRVGESLPPWSPGTLDIHQIGTGQGNSALFILPDGTTMLLDAGDNSDSPGSGRVHPPPDTSRTPADWILRYIRRMVTHKSPAVIDYFVLTHFHQDHMGNASPKAKASKLGPYKLSGVTEVGDSIPIRHVLDRGWPDYAYPEPLRSGVVENYRAFLKWQAVNRGLRVERFAPGRNDQIVLLNDRARYGNFEIRNIAANGEIWAGEGMIARKHFPDLSGLPAEDRATENMCSIAFRLRYGTFNYFSGGDMPGSPPDGSPPWHDVETPVAKAVGPVDVLLLNHHGNMDSQNAFFLSTLRPRVELISVWSADHPGQNVLARLLSTRLYTGPRDIFATNMSAANKEVIGADLDKLKSDQGHIVVRVAPGGDSFRVFTLDNSAETYKVTSLHGPYITGRQ